MENCKMIPRTSLIFLLLFSSSVIKLSAQTSNQLDNYPAVKSALNKKNWTASKSYYLIAKATDSTIYLYWGNNSFKRRYNSELDLSSAEKLHVKWANKQYLILEYGTGSGVWIDIILPIDKEEKVQEFANGECFDKIYNLFTYQGYNDTIVIVRNLKTKTQQFIIDEEHKCDAVLNSSCIDAIEIKNKTLYIMWVTPNNFINKKKTYNKKIKLQI